LGRAGVRRPFRHMNLTSMRRDTARDIVVGGAQVLGTLAGAPLLRRRYQRWGATELEVERPLPGDHLVPEPQLQSTRAIDIAAPPTRVWPWLMQLGWGRGGLYSFDGLENLIGCDLHSADVLLDDVEPFEIGGLLRAGPPGYPAWQVVELDEPHHLVLLAIDPRNPDPGRAVEPPEPTESTEAATVHEASSWQWTLEAICDGRRTRLITRTRTSYRPGTAVLWHVLEPVSFVMERRMLLGLRDRAEAAERSPGECE
jgi:hypothetical protein